MRHSRPLEAELAALADADTRRVELEAEAARLAQRETALNELARSLTECQHRNTAARAAQEAYRQAAGRQTEAHSARDTLERAFLDAQAGLLAQTLEEGAACPVCGSTHHPAKAHLPRTAPTEVQVNQAKQAAAQTDSAHRRPVPPALGSTDAGAGGPRPAAEGCRSAPARTVHFA